MTTQTNKQYKTIVTILVILVLIGISLVVDASFNHLNSKEKKQLAYKNKKDAIGKLYSERKHHFEDFTEHNAKWWNESMAKLTLNHTRDTVQHPEYTVKEFVRYHQDLKSSITTFKNDRDFINRFSTDQIEALFPIDYNLQNFLGTIRVEEQLFKDVEKLDGFYYQILNSTKKTDAVKFKYSDLHSPFTPYFKLLREMDRTIYDLIDSRYPDDLVFLGNTYPDLAQRAKEQLFWKQTNELFLAYLALKQDSIQPGKTIKVLTNTVASDTTTTIYTVFKNHNKTLIATYTDKEVYSLKPEERVSFLNAVDVLVPKEANEEERYYYVKSVESGPYYATDANKAFQPHVLEGDDAKILQFYEDDLERYYILGNYSAFDIYYPGYEEEKRDSVLISNYVR